MSHPRRRFRALLSLFLASIVSTTAPVLADTTLHIIDLKHRPAAEILPAVQPLVEPGGSITGLGFQLIVNVSDRNFEAIESAVDALDTPERMLRISVREIGDRSAIENMQEVSGSERVGNARVFISSGNARKSMVLGAATRAPGSSGLRLRMEQHTSTVEQGDSQSLSVLDGGHAFITVGRSLPQIQPYIQLANGRLSTGTAMNYRDVTTGFDISPSVHEGRVRIQITPRFAFSGNGSTQPVDFQELSTTVNARLGEWVDVGGSAETDSQVTRAILGRSAASGGTGTRVLIRVDE